MNILEMRLQKILEENSAGFKDSLQLSGIDVERGNWSVDAVNKTAQAGAMALVQLVSLGSVSDQCRNTFLQMIAENLDAEGCTLTMAWIYAAYELAGRFPPYAIIQHMVDPVLFHQYCACLRKWLRVYLQGDSGDSAFLSPGTSNH